MEEYDQKGNKVFVSLISDRIIVKIVIIITVAPRKGECHIRQDKDI